MYTEPNLFLGLLHVVLTKYGPKKKKRMKKSKVPECTAQWIQRSSQLVLRCHQLCFNHCVICCFPALNFVKTCLPRSKWCSKSK
jgi:hypothetical protein